MREQIPEIMEDVYKRQVGGCRVDFSYTGFGRNGADNWYVQNGQVQFGYTGIVTAKDETNRTYVCYVTNGRLDTDYTLSLIHI